MVKHIKTKSRPTAIDVNQIVKTHFNESNGFGIHKSIAIELLKETIKILEEFDINYFLICGTLLGYVRHNDFIPWDDDVDLLVHDSLFEKLPDILNKYKNSFNIMYKNVRDATKICFKDKVVEIKAGDWNDHMLNENGKYNWPFVDMFAYQIKADENKIHFFHKDWDYDKFFPIEKVDFLNLNVSIPKDPHYFLRSNFGNDYMTKIKSNEWSHKKEERIYDFKKIDINYIN